MIPIDLESVRIMAKDGNRAPSRTSRRDVPVCYHCASIDTMEPFHRSATIPLLSRVLPGLRRRYCRNCARHFLCWLPRSRSVA